MTRRHWRILAVVLTTVALVAGACGDDDDGATPGGQSTETTRSKAPPEFEEGTTMAALQEKGKIVIGTKFDQPGFGLKAPTGDVEGFDVEVGKLLAAALFGGSAEDAADKIEFVETVSANREPFIQGGRVDVVIATYTINDTRKQVVDFAGPYFVAEQDILVKADNSDIKGVNDLNGQNVCTVKGSTSEKNLLAKAPQAKTTLLDRYSLCVDELANGRVVAVTTDNAILQGFVKDSPGEYKLVKAPFSEEPYGIGLKKGDDEFRNFINDFLEDSFENGDWEEAFAKTLGPDGLGLDVPEPPEVDRYSGTPPAPTTTAAG